MRVSKKFWLFWFHSPLLPESLLISFPIGTVMFYLPTFYTIRFTLGLYKYSYCIYTFSIILPFQHIC